MTAAPTRVRELPRERVLSFAESLPAGQRETVLELAGKWKHGWIPLDAIAAAIKAKQMKGDGVRRPGANPGAVARPAGKSRLDPQGAARHAAVISGTRGKARPPAGRRAPTSSAGATPRNRAERRAGAANTRADNHQAAAQTYNQESSEAFRATSAARTGQGNHEDAADAHRAAASAAEHAGFDDRAAEHRQLADQHEIQHERAAEQADGGTKAPDVSAQAAEAVRLKAPELKARAAKGDRVAAAELERRAAKRQGKASTSAAAEQALHDRYAAAKTPAEKHAAASELAQHYTAARKTTQAKNWQRAAAKHDPGEPAGSSTPEHIKKMSANEMRAELTGKRTTADEPHTAAVAGIGDGAATPAGMPTISQEDAMRRLAASYTHTELARELKRAKQGSTAHRVLHEEGVRRLQQAEHPDAPPRETPPEPTPAAAPKKPRKPSELHQEWRRERDAQMTRFENHLRHGANMSEAEYFGEGDSAGKNTAVEQRLRYSDFLQARRDGKEHDRRQQQAYDAGSKLGVAHGQQDDSSSHEAEYQHHAAAHGSDGEDMFGQGYTDGILAGAQKHEQAQKAKQAESDKAFQQARDKAGAASIRADRANTTAEHKTAVLAHADAGKAALAAGHRDAAQHHIAQAQKHKAAHAAAAQREAEVGDPVRVNERLRAESIARGDARTPEEKSQQATDLSMGIRVQDNRHDTPGDWRHVLASRWTTPEQKASAKRKLDAHKAGEHHREYAAIRNSPLEKMSNAELAQFVKDNPIGKSSMTPARKRAVAQFLRERAASAKAQGVRDSTQRQHVAARESIAPSSADITAAAERWKAEHPGQKLAGHEREVDALAQRIAADKFVRTGVRSQNTPDEAASEKARAAGAAGREDAFKRDTAGRLAAEQRGDFTTAHRDELNRALQATTTARASGKVSDHRAAAVAHRGAARTDNPRAAQHRRVAELHDRTATRILRENELTGLRRQAEAHHEEHGVGPHGLKPGDKIRARGVGVAGTIEGRYIGRDINGKARIQYAHGGQMVTTSVSDESKLEPFNPTSGSNGVLAGAGGDWNALAAMNRGRGPEARARLAENIGASNAEKIARDAAAYPVGTKVTVGPQKRAAEVIDHRAGGIKIRFAESGKETFVGQDSLQPAGKVRLEGNQSIVITGPNAGKVSDGTSASRGAFPVGQRVENEFGKGTVTEATDRSTTVKLDNGETLNIQRGTPGHGRIKPLEEPASGARARSMPPAETFKGVHVETYKGEKITVRKGREFGTLQVEINGHPVSTPHGRTNADAVRQLDITRGTIDHAKANPGNYTNGDGEASYGMRLEQPASAARQFGQAANSGQRANIGEAQAQARKAAQGPPQQGEMFGGHGEHQGDIFDQPPAAPSIRVEHSGDGTVVYGTERGDTAATEALKAQGFKWSRSLGGWYLPRTWNESTRELRVRGLQARLGDKIEVQRGELAPSGTAAERQQAQIDRAKAIADQQRSRAERFRQESDQHHAAVQRISDGIPFGQPILVGHHSEGRARRDQERMHNGMRRSIAAQDNAQHAEQRAQSAEARARLLGDPKAAARRLERAEAELRGVERRLNGSGKEIHGEHRPASGDYAERLKARQQALQQQIAHDREIAGDVLTRFGKHNVSAGDVVVIRGHASVVHSTGPKNVKVLTSVGALPYPYTQITGHGKLEEASTASLKSLLESTRNTRLPQPIIDRINTILRARGEG